MFNEAVSNNHLYKLYNTRMATQHRHVRWTGGFPALWTSLSMWVTSQSWTRYIIVVEKWNSSFVIRPSTLNLDMYVVNIHVFQRQVRPIACVF